ncbi:MAG: hypothetical protein AAF191_04765 [Verrucomicrobiota bacterium]
MNQDSPFFDPSTINLSDPLWVLALGVSFVALSLLIMAVIALASLGSLRTQLKRAVDQLGVAADTRKRERTLEAVRRYETDPQLREAIRSNYTKTDQGQNYSLLDESDQFNILTVLNYFDGIACGIEQGLLIEPLVKDYLQFVLDKAVRALLLGQSGPNWNAGPPLVESDNYTVLLNLHQRWHANQNRSLYEMLR